MVEENTGVESAASLSLAYMLIILAARREKASRNFFMQNIYL